jgi:hypothetical protein
MMVNCTLPVNSDSTHDTRGLWYFNSSGMCYSLFAMTRAPKLDPAVRAALQALGRIGGKKGGPARMAQLSAAERKALARKAIRARWAKVKRRKTT